MPSSGDAELAEILDDLSSYYRRHITFQQPQEEADAIALWTYQTHIFQHFDQVAYLGVTSPTRECGKSALLEVLMATCCRAKFMVRPSPAVFFRSIDAMRPTILLDEVDTIFNAKSDYEELRAALNAGIRAHATVPRCVQGKDGEIGLQEFSVFCPKVLAGIGELPDTVASRCISIRMQRRLGTDRPTERVRTVQKEREGKYLHDRILRHMKPDTWDTWDTWDTFPEALGDRACDYWEPLLVIAGEAGEEWVDRCLRAAVHIETSRDSEREMPLNMRLLTDVVDVLSIGRFQASKSDAFTQSGELAARLNALEEAPWGGMRRDLGLSTKALASFLRDFGIRPEQSADRGSRGYYHRDIARVAEKYLR